MVLSDCPKPIDVDDGAQVPEARIAAALAASQTEPSAHSPSPMRTKVLGRGLHELLGEGHPHPDRQALPQGAGGRLDPVHPGRRMALEGARDLPKGENLGRGDDPGLGVSGPEDGRGVSLGQDELVVGPVPRIRDVDAHLVEEQAGHEVGRGEAGRRVPRAGPGRSSSGNGCAALLAISVQDIGLGHWQGLLLERGPHYNTFVRGEAIA